LTVGRPTGCYTLLADDNSRFSNEAALRDSFKAHLVYNLILNGRIAFSDNQVICSSNLQELAATDPTIIALFEEGFFDLAVRADFGPNGGVAPLRAVHEAFVREQKVRHAAIDFDSTPALARIEKRARPIPWSYGAIRENYTGTCERLLLREFGRQLAIRELDRLREIIEAEKERDSGLGREFLQNRLHRQLRKAGIVVDAERRKLIRHCTDAPYLSNLPSLIGLNPIYAEEHRASFDLMRGGGIAFETTDGVKAGSPFDYEHYVAGLCRLTVDDIHALQELPSRDAYLRLSGGGITDEGKYDEAFRAFIEFNLLIEDRIASRFPEIVRRSPSLPDRTFYKQKAKTYAEAGAEDVFGILVGMVCPVLPLALCKQLILDLWPFGAEKAARSLRSDVVEREARKKQLASHLDRAGAADRLQVEDRPVSGSCFAKEIIIS
jgi:hypothetical protein